MEYNFSKIENKWLKKWEDEKAFVCDLDQKENNYYALTMFPYPSGKGLHVGHILCYVATDVLARYKRHLGLNVLFPMGWDAFGLPAEQYAIETGNDPEKFTLKNIETFKKQIRLSGLSVTWDHEIMTSDPNYYKYTQWIFTKLLEKDLAYLADVEVNWCEKLGTVLANEEVVTKNGKMVSERGSHPVEKRPMKQWVLKITKYADKLLSGLDTLDWPQAIKEIQRNWIGKSFGAEINFKLKDFDESITVFTTRPDTIFGVSYCVVSPEHKLLNKLKLTDEVKEYIRLAKLKSDLERTSLQKEKTGVYLGIDVVHPFTRELIPLYVADYVLSSYGTGAVMAVPAHDERDYEFSLKHNLKIKKVLECTSLPFTGDSKHINSEFLNGLNNKDAISKVIEEIKQKKIGKEKVNYKLRDWIFSRQRYWGEPFPVIFWENGDIEILKKENLPLILPRLKKVELSKTGESPLALAKDWLYLEKAGVKGKKDTNTMPQWAGSSWYYLAYLLKDKDGYIDIDSKKAYDRFKAWLPVNTYIGGAEHAVSHLLYSRFWHKVLFDEKIVPTAEPYKKLFNQGMILGENGEKMSKSLNNTISPDSVISEYGADTLRCFEMFLGPLEASKPWNTEAIGGPYRFIERVWRFFTEILVFSETDDLEQIFHQTVKKVTLDYENLSFNTAISQLMIFLNECYKVKKITKAHALNFLVMLNPIAPFITEELNEMIFKSKSLVYAPWPQFDETKIKSSTVEVVFLVNGKLKSKATVKKDISEKELEKLCLENEKVKTYIKNSQIKKIIVVKNKLVNIVL